MKVTELTQAQRDLFPHYREMYTNKVFGDNPPANFEDVEKYVLWFYQTFDISPNKTPKVFLLDSPMELLQEIAGQTGKELTWYAPNYYLSGFNAWVSHFDFFDKECFKLEKSELFNEYKKVLDLNIFWSVCFENAVFVCRNAKKYFRDAERRLHNVDGPAVIFPGDMAYSLNFIHGVALSQEIFDKLQNKEYTFDDFVEEKNEEIKNAVMAFMLEKWGPEYLADFISSRLEKVNTFVDKKKPEFLEGTSGGMNVGVYTLFKGTDPDLAFVQCFCPSSDRMFMLGCSPEITTAKDAVASLYRIPRKLKPEIKYIQRQGERYFTVFTDKGNELLPTLAEAEISDLVQITGDEYFGLMRYEY